LVDFYNFLYRWKLGVDTPEIFIIYFIIIITYFISISKTNDNNKAPEQHIDTRMKKNKAKA